MLRRFWLFFAQAVTVLLALMFIVVTLKPQWLQRQGQLGKQLATPIVALREVAPGIGGAPATTSYAEAAQKAGRFDDEIVAYTVKGRKGDTTVDKDEYIRTGATIDAESGRPLAAMVAASVDLPVTMLLSAVVSVVPNNDATSAVSSKRRPMISGWSAQITVPSLLQSLT